MCLKDLQLVINQTRIENVDKYVCLGQIITPTQGNVVEEGKKENRKIHSYGQTHMK